MPIQRPVRAQNRGQTKLLGSNAKKKIEKDDGAKNKHGLL